MGTLCRGGTTVMDGTGVIYHCEVVRQGRLWEGPCGDEEAEGGEAVTNHDGWFFVAFGAFFLLIATRVGRELGNGLEGPWTPEQRRTDVVRHTWAARIGGAVSITYGCWLLWR